MHVLFVHPNYPAQFGHIAHHLAAVKGWRCTFVSETPPGKGAPDPSSGGSIEKIRYQTDGGAIKENHFCSRTFENTVWHCDGVMRTLAGRPDIEPDLIVGHSGFGSTLFLRELFPTVPCVNLFEYYYQAHGVDSDMTFRHDLGWPVGPEKFLRSRCRNAMILLDLQNCQVGYCPTLFQRSRFPDEYADKLKVVFDGIDTGVWNRSAAPKWTPGRNATQREVADLKLPAGAKLVTYCSRGFESMRGFDIFMRAAVRITRERPDAHVAIVGSDRIAYGGDEQHTGGRSFKDWTMDLPEVRNADLSRIHFVGRLAPVKLAQMLASSDVHLYLTVPFVLSWSLINAMACGARIVASDTAPVREVITDGENGLLADFFDPDAFAEKAMRVLDDPAGHAFLGEAAERTVAQRYSLEVTMPQMLAVYEEAQQIKRGLEAARPRLVVRPPSSPVPASTPFSTARTIR